jgi:hypothetical protein
MVDVLDVGTCVPPGFCVGNCGACVGADETGGTVEDVEGMVPEACVDVGVPAEVCLDAVGEAVDVGCTRGVAVGTEVFPDCKGVLPFGAEFDSGIFAWLFPPGAA